MFKIATWNVNSLKVRLAQVVDWLKTHQPDVLALQEIKSKDFPSAIFQELGYHSVFAGQATYNGVAVLSRQVSDGIITDFPTFEDLQRRILAARFPFNSATFPTTQTVRVLNLYVPNGEALDSEKYVYKLTWLQHCQQFIAQHFQQFPDEPLIVLGDFNIAPQDEDVHDVNAWKNSVLTSPAERQALQTILDLGLQDCFRNFSQAEKSFSWWDYRAAAFKRNRGLRIDLILASTAFAKNCESCVIDKEPRALERPSDHTPVVAVFK